MVYLQIVGRDGSNLQSELRTAIAEGRITSFEVAQVRGGVKLRHVRYLGEIKLDQMRSPTAPGPLIVTVICKDRSKEWQLLSAFIGRLADHFKDEISSINIQLEPNDGVPKRAVAKKKRARRKR
jgi:hypothetical protein